MILVIWIMEMHSTKYSGDHRLLRCLSTYCSKSSRQVSSRQTCHGLCRSEVGSLCGHMIDGDYMEIMMDYVVVIWWFYVITEGKPKKNRFSIKWWENLNRKPNLGFSS